MNPESPVLSSDIRDIRGPLAEGPPWWEGLETWGLVLLAALVATAALWLLWRVLRRPESAEKVALAKIAAAESRGASPKDFAHEVSEAVREYVEARFGVHAPQRTTEELLEELASSTHSPLVRHQPVLASFLGHCDLAKFGGASLGEEERSALAQSARDFVMESDAEAATDRDDDERELAAAPVGGAS